ncbi:hypothetical protein [Helcobacillus massiliensis]|uniref:Lysyl-tRNA synthetase n=1 Tax=Helcobacillus massiliensis TaxID=521392 RepID=A0A839QQ80_9MICO|nr:hypothetical protein [Helcobacillus massiliensis]MBB3022653.1 hypothetical protein [Helcobacillus massiliensis]
MDIWFELGALVPSIGVGLLFWFVLRSIVRADRGQRAAEREAEREWELHHGSPDSPSQSPAPEGRE